jgi:hypothetical protein
MVAEPRVRFGQTTVPSNVTLAVGTFLIVAQRGGQILAHGRGLEGEDFVFGQILDDTPSLGRFQTAQQLEHRQAGGAGDGGDMKARAVHGGRLQSLEHFRFDAFQRLAGRLDHRARNLQSTGRSWSNGKFRAVFVQRLAVPEMLDPRDIGPHNQARTGFH